MRRRSWVTFVIMAIAAIALAVPSQGLAQQKKLIYWTMWDQNPEFNKWYEPRGKDFAKKTGYEVEVVTIPYQGYEAKYLRPSWGGPVPPTCSWG